MLSKTIIIYKSKYGTTEKYANWLADELGCDICGCKGIGKIDFNKYSTVIYGAGIYAGGIGAKNITSCWETLKEKKIIIFTVGLSDPEKTDYQPIIDKGFNSEQKQMIKFFHLRGGIDYKSLGFVDKMLMAMLVSVMKKKPEAELSDDSRMMLEAYGNKADFTDRKQIKPILEYAVSKTV